MIQGEVPSRTLPSSIAPKANPADQCSKEQLPKVSLKFILHATGNIAAKFPYNQVLVDAFRKIPKATWNAKESSIFSSNVIKVENLHPLVQRAIAAASAQPDLQLWMFPQSSLSLAEKVPCEVPGCNIEAIAVAACVRDSWPVLILAPSSLRLHWASMIEQWLNIPPPDIVVVFSQMGGSNRSGFTILSSNSKGDIHLDGLFNIISYDLVAKLENVLMASEFKVND
ncbi:hypothetical protein GOBAR_DD12934 [Gossypium barbadense]|nr:hypothetical protein GOBAR_DD12934 [Gossypium barbadense]